VTACLGQGRNDAGAAAAPLQDHVFRAQGSSCERVRRQHVCVSCDSAAASARAQHTQKAQTSLAASNAAALPPTHLAGHRRQRASLAAGERRCVVRAAGQRERRASACGRGAQGAPPHTHHAAALTHAEQAGGARRHIRVRCTSIPGGAHPASQCRPFRSSRTRPRRAPLRAERLAHARPPAGAAPRHAGLASAARTVPQKRCQECPASCMT
jgi:hypothetical protein